MKDETTHKTTADKVETRGRKTIDDQPRLKRNPMITADNWQLLKDIGKDDEASKGNASEGISRLCEFYRKHQGGDMQG